MITDFFLVVQLYVRIRDGPGPTSGITVTHFDCNPEGGPGVIEACGLVSVGDALVQVDGHDVTGNTPVSKVTSLIKNATGPTLVLRFATKRRVEETREEELRKRVGDMTEGQRAGAIKALFDVRTFGAVGSLTHSFHVCVS